MAMAGGTYTTCYTSKDRIALLPGVVKVLRFATHEGSEGRADGVQDATAKSGGKEPDGAQASIDDLDRRRGVGPATTGAEQVQRNIKTRSQADQNTDEDTRRA